MVRFERGLRPRNRVLGGTFGRGAEPPSELLAAGVAAANAFQASRSLDAARVEEVSRDHPENLQTVYAGRPEAGRRRLRKVTHRHRDFLDAKSRRDSLRNDLLIEHESIGVHPEVHGFEHLAVERAIAGVEL